jgi:cytoskeletal protein RodZ
MSSVAEQLRLGREANHLTVENVAQITKIRGDHLRALEEGDFGAFSAPVYIRGFVRSYAKVLRLNEAEVMKNLDEELKKTPEFADPPPLSPPSDGLLDKLMLLLSKVNWLRGAIFIGLVLLLAALVWARVLWRHYSSIDPLAGLKPGIYQTPQTEVGETLPLTAVRPNR